MKKMFVLSCFVLLITLILPLLLVPGFYFYRPAESEPPVSPEPSPTEAPTPTPIPSPPTIEPIQGLDASLSLSVLLGGDIVQMSMEEYLLGVVAAEMPARFHPEALRAQAIAARTYTLYRMLLEPAGRHPNAYVCGAYTCCKAYHPPERLKERWGNDFDHYLAIIQEAIDSTDGIILLFEDMPILAAFHSSSYGFTEASGAIWGDLPYLQSVESFESAYDVPRFYDVTTLSFPQFREVVQASLSDVTLSDDNISYWISDVQYTPSGRLASVDIGGALVTGAQFRRMFSLRSAHVTLSFDEQGITISTGGYGHGVGMSQFGANTMAHMGYDFSEILLWYYSGVRLGHFNILFD